MASDTPRPAVTVLLATRNGGKYLRAQLDSLATQTLPPARVMISDDGSTDDTRAIIRAFAAECPAIRVSLLDGPGLGAAMNFRFLLMQAPEETGFVALCDQDDVWLPDKLARAVRMLAGTGEPALYCARSWEWDEKRDRRHLSRPAPPRPGFRHALVQNIAGGNTMLLNRAALALMREAGREVRELVVHDWWIYQVLSGAGARVVHDDRPVLLYRQHAGNLIGANRGLPAKLRRLGFMLAGGYREWTRINIENLNAARHLLTPEAREILDLFAKNRDGSLPERLAMLRRTGLHRHGRLAQAALYLAALLRRL